MTKVFIPEDEPRPEEEERIIIEQEKYRCDICGFYYSKEEVHEFTQPIQTQSGQWLKLYYHICRYCDLREVNRGILKKEKEEKK